MVQEKAFREDLYYRLNVVRIETPAPRTAWKTLLNSVDFMLVRLDKNLQPGQGNPTEAMEILQAYQWPGNAGTRKTPFIPPQSFPRKRILPRICPKVFRLQVLNLTFPQVRLNLLRLNSLLQHPPQKEFLMLV